MIGPLLPGSPFSPLSDEHESSEGDCDNAVATNTKIIIIRQMSMNPRKGTVTDSSPRVTAGTECLSDEHESSEGDCDIGAPAPRGP